MKRPMALSLLLAAGAVLASAPTASDAVRKIRADVEYLASDSLRGRRAGTPDADAAAAFVAEAFRSAGLLPAGVRGSYFQRFDFIDGVELGKGNALAVAAGGEVGRVLEVGKEFLPLGFSSPGRVEAGVVFAGYG